MDELIERLRHFATKVHHEPMESAMREAADALTTMQAREATLISLLDDAFDFLGGVDGASEIRHRILEALATSDLAEG